MKRLDDSEGLAVFSIDFEAIGKRDQLVKWLADSWGPAVRKRGSLIRFPSPPHPTPVPGCISNTRIV